MTIAKITKTGVAGVINWADRNLAVILLVGLFSSAVAAVAVITLIAREVADGQPLPALALIIPGLLLAWEIRQSQIEEKQEQRERQSRWARGNLDEEELACVDVPDRDSDSDWPDPRTPRPMLIIATATAGLVLIVLIFLLLGPALLTTPPQTHH